MLKSQKATYLGKLRSLRIRSFDSIKFNKWLRYPETTEGFIHAMHVYQTEENRTQDEYRRMLWNG